MSLLTPLLLTVTGLQWLPDLSLLSLGYFLCFQASFGFFCLCGFQGMFTSRSFS